MHDETQTSAPTHFPASTFNELLFRPLILWIEHSASEMTTETPGEETAPVKASTIFSV